MLIVIYECHIEHWLLHYNSIFFLGLVFTIIFSSNGIKQFSPFLQITAFFNETVINLLSKTVEFY